MGQRLGVIVMSQITNETIIDQSDCETKSKEIIIELTFSNKFWVPVENLINNGLKTKGTSHRTELPIVCCKIQK
jgi:hypothetical protein